MSKTYSTTIEITEEKEYSVTINAGLDLASWIIAGSTTEFPLDPSSYESFEELEADEKAIRQLMLVHASVDYLATASADDSLMESIINSDICAKWINLSDYALDTLSANTNIKSVMDEADKYGYGEIGTANIATDTTKVSASGQYSSDYAASKAINTTPASGNKGWISPGGSSNAYLDYDCGEDVSIVYINIGYCASSGVSTTARYKIQGKKNGSSEWVDLTNEYTSILLNQWTKLTPIVSDTFRYYRLLEIERAVGGNGWVIQYCKYQPLGNVPIMTANNAPYGTASASSEYSASYAAWKAFDGVNTTAASWQSASNANTGHIIYEFVNPICPKQVSFMPAYNTVSEPYCKDWEVRGSNDGTQWSDPLASDTVVPSSQMETYTEDVSASTYYKYLKFAINGTYAPHGEVGLSSLQFYGRELKLVNGTPTPDYSEKEFAQGSTRKTIYDHGVELESMTAQQTGGTAEKESSQIYVKISTSNSSANVHTSSKVTFTSGSYSRLRGIVGNKAQRTNGTALPLMYVDDSTYGVTTFKAATISEVAQNPREAYTLDVSSIVGDKYIGYGASTSGTSLIDEGSLTELWLE